jgi:macrolide-specific efflux system membrane fusion protein
MRLKLFAIVLLLVVGGAAVFVTLGGLPRSAAASTTFLTSTAAVADVTNDVAATGSVASATTWSLAFGAAPTTATASSSSGAATQDGTWTARTVTAKVGDVVKKGDVLAIATNPTLAADIVAAKNDWTAAELQRLEASDGYDSAVTAGNTASIRQARSALLNARNGVASAHQKLLDLKSEATLNQLVAPADGTVTAVNVTAGADVPSGAAITMATSDYQVTAEVVESDIAAMRLQQPATVTISAIGADLDGIVTAIAPTASSSSGSSSSVVSYAVTVSLTKPPATLRPGMTADVTITTASASGVLAVPAAALRGAAGNYTVLVMTSSGTPEAHAVTVGLITSSLVEIKTGLSAGDIVVTGTSSTQRSASGTGIGGGGGNFVVPGGGGGGFGGFGNKP